MTFGRQLCCHFCYRHDLGITGRLAFLARARWGSWLVDFLFQGLEFLAFVRMNTLTYEWSLASPTRANQKPGSRGPSNRGRGLRRSSQSYPGRLRAFILDFPVVFHSQKRERGKVRKKKKLPFIKKPALARKVLTCLSFFPPGRTQRTSLCLPHIMSLPPLLMKSSDKAGKQKQVAPASAGSLYISTKTDAIHLKNMHSCILEVLKSAPHENHRI